MPPKFRYVGVTDECTECQQCGKTELKNTIVLYFLDEDGNDEDVTYFGSTCAARALGIRGGGRAVLDAARNAHIQLTQDVADARKMLAYYGLPETGGVDFDTLRAAARKYARAHFRAMWAPSKTPEDWRAMTLDMLARKQAVLAEAALIGA